MRNVPTVDNFWTREIDHFLIREIHHVLRSKMKRYRHKKSYTSKIDSVDLRKNK